MRGARARIADGFWLALAGLVLALGVVIFFIAWALILAEEACVDLAVRLTPRPKPAEPRRHKVTRVRQVEREPFNFDELIAKHGNPDDDWRHG